MGKILYVKTLKKNLVDPTKPKKTYATAQSRDVYDLDRLGEHMASHGCAYDAADITAIVKKAVRCSQELLKDGCVIKLGSLGSFRITLNSRGVCESVIDPETKEKPVFTANDITGIKVHWRPGNLFKSDAMMDGVEFEETITTKRRNEVIKENKATRVDGTDEEEDDEPEVHE